MTHRQQTTADNLTLIAGVGDGKHTACLMSARALLDGRPFGDSHPSAVLRSLGIRINDGPWWDSDAERTAMLLPLAMDERLCAAKCVVTPEAEADRRRTICDWAVPYAMDAAIRAMTVVAERLPSLRPALERLERERSRSAAADAANAAYAARDASRRISRYHLIRLFMECLEAGQ